MQRTISALVMAAASLIAAQRIVFAQETAAPAGAPQVIVISARKYEFSPSEIHVRKGARVELKVHSEDETHGVKLDIFPEGAKDKNSRVCCSISPAKTAK